MCEKLLQSYLLSGNISTTKERRTDSRTPGKVKAGTATGARFRKTTTNHYTMKGAGDGEKGKML